MWSMCSMLTGHASTHAPQVTQSHAISSSCAVPATARAFVVAARSAFGPSANRWSRTPMITSLGDSVLPVK